MKIFSLLLFLSLSLMAEKTEWFVGLEGGTAGVKYAENVNDIDRKFGLQYGLKVGLVNELSRIYIGYSQSDNNSNKNSSSQSGYLSLEGVGEEFQVFSKSTAKVFLGVHLGGNSATLQGEQKDAFIGGVQIGLIFLLPANFEIETAYRHQWTYNDTLTNFNTVNPYLALNYKF